MSRPRAISGSREERIAQIAGFQRGRVAHAQLLAAGLANRTIYRLAAQGHLRREHRGVYAVGHTAPIPLGPETAALLACGDHAVLSHYTAALIHKLIPHGDGQIHVTIRGRHGPEPTGVKVHRATTLNRGEVDIVEALPITSPARTIFDLAATADLATTERAVEEALTQKKVTERGLRTLARRVRGHRGAKLVPAILDAYKEPGITKSKAERRFRALLRAAQLPQPKTNFPFRGYSLDCYWPELGVVVEIQGYQFHSSRKKFERDTRKAATLTAAGLTVAYVTWLQMENEPYAVIARTAQMLALAQARQQAA
ncbi:MAG TPA: type IV toxin-antitoxin system AbiEi family antitoxin domain-containing protein [Solirubrobacteraceae bacterium]|nr:type IV toxin-antitoxin system AbiEi family antitoxin domain-containing protein [Solirubrobacteraceae bacterium]